MKIKYIYIMNEHVLDYLLRSVNSDNDKFSIYLLWSLGFKDFEAVTALKVTIL